MMMCGGGVRWNPGGSMDTLSRVTGKQSLRCFHFSRCGGRNVSTFSFNSSFVLVK